AKAVHVSESSEIEGIDLTFSPPSPTRIPDAPKPVYAGPTGTGTISGRVVSEPGPPISGVAVTLIPASAGAAKRLARTNAQGRFEFSELPQGRFSISATAPGYVEWEFGQRRPSEPGTVVELSDGGSFNKADIRLPRQLAIEGTILDEFGDPAPGVTLQPARWQFIAARKRLFPIEGRGMRQTTDDKGHYRLPALPPGEYFLAAQTGVFSDDPDMGGFAPTYFPGTVDVSAAASLQLTVGSGNLTANFSLVPATTVTVSGVAVDHDGAAVSNAAILLTTRDALKKPEARITRASAGSDGRFTLRNVPQGAYTLQGFGHPPAGGPGNLNAGPFGWSPVMVGDSDVDGVILTIVPGRTLRGRVSREDPDGPALATAGVRVMPIPVDFDSAPVAGGPLPSVTHEDGTFEVTNVNGIVRLFVNSGSPSWVVKRISVDGRDVTDAPLDLREHDVSGIDVVMTSRITHVSGGVTNEKNESLSDYAVVVFSVDPGKWGDRSRFIRLVRPADNGRFSVNGLPAEDYLAIALPNVNAIEYFDPDFLQALRPLATSFTLQEGGSQTLELKLTRRPIT
ncbi:MAG TPA: carboxypeptidase-like regulatory domain-containing protein, partial [Vicinamibacterales bacterium]